MPETLQARGGRGARDGAPADRLCAECSQLIPLGSEGTRPAIAEKLDIGCGSLAVPLDHGVAGAVLSLKLVRVRHREQTDRIGSLVLNPGGPGVAGVEFAAGFATRASEELLKRFDVIGFDPRGVGESAPVRCNGDADLDRLLDRRGDTPAARAESVAETRRMSASCKEKLGGSAEFFSTEATARDLDLIRSAVGDPKLTYVGFSYGAKLGATYAHLFPRTVRALVLDAPSTSSPRTVRRGRRAPNSVTCGPCSPGCRLRPEPRLSPTRTRPTTAEPRAEPCCSASCPRSTTTPGGARWRTRCGWRGRATAPGSSTWRTPARGDGATTRSPTPSTLRS